MINDNNVYYRKQNRNIALRVLIALLILVAIAAAIIFIDKNIAERTMADIVSADYASEEFYFQKSEDTERAGYVMDQRQEETLGKYEYVTPLGFSIVSQSEKWTEEKLVEVYEELLKNGHGAEINYISKIVIYPGASDIGLTDSNVAGTHSQQRSEYRIFFDLPALLPSSMEYVIKSDLSVIELYNMDAYDDISQAARTISHEYGHHYTMYYFLQSDEDAKTSEYYTLRGIGQFDHDVFFDSVADYYANHGWSIYEIAAEDYVQLMGSGSGNRTEEYLDVYDLVTDYEADTYYRSYDENIVNVYPQENVYIPLAGEVRGLRDYYYSYIGLENDMDPVEPADFNISIEKKSNLGYTYYNITWDKPSTNPDALYTLVCYDMDGNLYSAIRTVYGDQKAIACVGDYVEFVNGQPKGFTSDVTTTDRYFRLYLLLPDGQMQSSELFYADF